MALCKQTMINSYNWTSFNPEKRGEADFNYYTELLAEDMQLLLATQDSTGNYAEKFQDKVMTIFHRQARCASPMITGPANFNNRRNGKAWDSRDNAVKEFDHWRAKYLKAVTRERTLSPEEEIDKTLEELERMELKFEMYKEMNKLKTVELKRAYAEENDFMEVFNYWMNYGGVVPSYHITSTRNKINERKKKLEIMQARIEAKAAFTQITFEGGYIDVANDRVVIKHEQKPPKEVIEEIKRNGFRYSPKTQSWVRKHTANAIDAAMKLVPVLGLKYGV